MIWHHLQTTQYTFPTIIIIQRIFCAAMPWCGIRSLFMLNCYFHQMNRKTNSKNRRTTVGGSYLFPKRKIALLTRHFALAASFVSQHWTCRKTKRMWLDRDFTSTLKSQQRMTTQKAVIHLVIALVLVNFTSSKA